MTDYRVVMVREQPPIETEQPQRAYRVLTDSEERAVEVARWAFAESLDEECDPELHRVVSVEEVSGG
jgi:hypothetical protein